MGLAAGLVAARAGAAAALRGVGCVTVRAAGCASCGAGRDVAVLGTALEVCETLPVGAALLGATAAFGATGAAGR